MKRSDTISILVLGEIVALSLIPFLIDTGLAQALRTILGFNILFILPILIPVLAFFALWILSQISAKLPILFQIGKFAAVGISNTTIDFGIFSLLKFVTHITFGLQIAGINVPGFSVAVVNSYLWNKFWTFKNEDIKKVPGEFFQFLVVSVIGVLINSLILFSLTTFMEPQFGLSRSLWATFAKVLATPISLVWNFIGYKFIVFKNRG